MLAMRAPNYPADKTIQSTANQEMGEGSSAAPPKEANVYQAGDEEPIIQLGEPQRENAPHDKQHYISNNYGAKSQQLVLADVLANPEECVEHSDDATRSLV